MQEFGPNWQYNYNNILYSVYVRSSLTKEKCYATYIWLNQLEDSQVQNSKLLL